MKQMNIALPDDLRERLRAAGEKSGQSIAEEIRSRVEASFARDIVTDKATLDFMEGIGLLMAEIELETGASWHKHAGTWDALRTAIVERLQRYRPKGPRTFGNRPHRTIPPMPGDDPVLIGELIERRLWAPPDFNMTRAEVRQVLERMYQEVERLSKERDKT
jgi:hypothetical protein